MTKKLKKTVSLNGTEESDQTLAELQVQSMMNSGILRIIQNIGMVVTSIAVCISPFWYMGVKLPMEKMDVRINNLESNVSDIKVNTGVIVKMMETNQTKK